MNETATPRTDIRTGDTDTGVTYQNAPYTLTIKQLWWQQQGLQQTATGYGRKLVTEYMIQCPGDITETPVLRHQNTRHSTVYREC